MKKNIYTNGLWLALGTVVYIVLVALLMQNAQSLFGAVSGVFGFVAFLLLFTFSATVVGALILGKPLTMYLNGEKKDAIAQLLATIGWLFIALVIVFVAILVKR